MSSACDSGKSVAAPSSSRHVPHEVNLEAPEEKEKGWTFVQKKGYENSSALSWSIPIGRSDSKRSRGKGGGGARRRRGRGRCDRANGKATIVTCDKKSVEEDHAATALVKTMRNAVPFVPAGVPSSYASVVKRDEAKAQVQQEEEEEEDGEREAEQVNVCMVASADRKTVAKAGNRKRERRPGRGVRAAAAAAAARANRRAAKDAWGVAAIASHSSAPREVTADPNMGTHTPCTPPRGITETAPGRGSDGGVLDTDSDEREKRMHKREEEEGKETVGGVKSGKATKKLSNGGNNRLRVFDLLFRDMDRAIHDLYFMCEVESAQAFAAEVALSLESLTPSHSYDIH